MLIVVEGNEGTGKTTLIDRLSEQLPFIRIKYSKDCENIFPDLEYFAFNRSLFVLDRGFVTDMVYRIRDGKQGQTSLAEIAELCKRGWVKIIFCNNDNGYEDALRRGENNITTRTDYDYVTGTFDRIKALLKCFTNVETFDYNYKCTSIDDVLKFIERRDNNAV